jgi:hypothetical protein
MLSRNKFLNSLIFSRHVMHAMAQENFCAICLSRLVYKKRPRWPQVLEKEKLIARFGPNKSVSAAVRLSVSVLLSILPHWRSQRV